MAYTTTVKVRQEAGMVNNTNLSDNTVITPLIEEAHSEVQGRISGRYVLSALTTLFTGSQAEKLLGRIEALLAAGYLLQREYPQEDGDNAEGDARVKRAIDLIDAIMDGSIKLLNTAGTEYTLLGSRASGISIGTTCPATDDEDRPSQFAVTDSNEF